MRMPNSYKEACILPSNMTEHVPVLKMYSEMCEHVTEFGVDEGFSTWGLLEGNPKKMVSVDKRQKRSMNFHKDFAKNLNIEYSFILSDSFDIEIEETDLLFIDTEHTYEQLKEELRLHASKVRKYIVLHDTEVFKIKGELPSTEGLQGAIDEFLEDNEEWGIKEVFTNCYGLTILEKEQEVEFSGFNVPESDDSSEVDGEDKEVLSEEEGS